MSTNVGYQIIVEVPLNNEEAIVIGYNPSKHFDQYVCWYRKDRDDYYWGKYFDSYEHAASVLAQRLTAYFTCYCCGS